MSGPPKAVRLLELRVPARADQLRTVRDAVREHAGSCGCRDQTLDDIVLAVDEACQNIIRHAYRGDPDGTIVLQIERCGDDLIFSLRDFAPPIDPETVRPRDLDDLRPGGLGTHFIHEVMDDTKFEQPPSGGGNLLKMVKRIE